ncbi:MAG TPA: DUF402 domain-containing protein [Roseiflexaceae bacterium]|nr:DUF402 domain-containing protein [Roseiflexaceae bacterium]
MAEFERVEVMRGKHSDPGFMFGPLPGYRQGDVIAYEWELPERFEPWPGRTRLERIFVLLDVGVSFANPCWARTTNHDGSITELDPHGTGFWYVDLVSVEMEDGRFVVRDLYIDVMVPTDGRHYRMLDLDEYADAIADGTIGVEQAIDGLRRWQRFLERYLHASRWPQPGWTDFPPQSIRQLSELPAPLGPIVRVEG